MVVSVDNLVFQFSVSTGTGNFTLSDMSADSPAQYFRKFSDAFGTGSTHKFFYCIRHRTANEFEVGIGYMSDATTLVRSTIIQSSNANAGVNFSGGTKDVICDVPSSIQSPYNYTAVSGNYQMLVNDFLMEVTGGSPTITLISAVGYVGPDIRVKLTGSGNATVAAAGIELIDGNASIVIGTQYASISFNSNGTGWLLL